MELTPVPAVIDRFAGEWRFLSNFSPCPWIVYDGDVYATTEHAYQAAKTLDLAARRAIRATQRPGDAKRIGAHVSLRPDWSIVQRVTIMRDLLVQKFAAGQPIDYLAGLLRTGDATLIEGNTWGDTFWGVCNGEGDNVLGTLLMEIRAARREATR